jgi:histidinol-phosphate phosphatase family protein
MTVSIVIPTVGRGTLATLLDSLAHRDGPVPAEVIVVDDRPGGPPLDVEYPGWLDGRTRILRSGGHGPAVARNAGWQAARSDWVAFLDDDVVVGNGWLRDLADDLGGAARDVAGVQGRITVPLPAQRCPNDWERNTAGLASARWITADMAYRRDALVTVDGFDERFPRAFREDADLALRTMDSGYRLVVGQRRTLHPARPAPWSASITQQRGNADDVLMRALHGPSWYERAGATVGRRRANLATAAAGVLALGAAATGRRRLAAAAAGAWAASTAQFARLRIAPGPRDLAEVARMVATSVAIPPAATWHLLAGLRRHRGARPWAEFAGRTADEPTEHGPAALDAAGHVAAVLVDRDGTIVRDVPYNGDPERVEPMPGARAALDRLRAAGIRVGVITNQSGVARGDLTRTQVDAVNARVDELLGPFDTWQVCPHGPDEGCACRKPRPGMLLAAAHAMGVPVGSCVMIGDTGADVEAGLAAGADAVLVPNEVTLQQEIDAAPHVYARFDEAVDALLKRAGVPS